MSIETITAADLTTEHTIVRDSGQWVPTAINAEMEDEIIVDVTCIEGNVDQQRTWRFAPDESIRVLDVVG